MKVTGKKAVQAKKDAALAEKNKKVVKNTVEVKKKHGCRNCFLSLICISLALTVGVFFTGDYFAKKYINIGLIDAVQTVWSLRSVNEKKIVTNKYSDADFIALNDELKNQLFLNEKAPLDTKDLLDKLVNKFLAPAPAEPPVDPPKANPNNNLPLNESIHILNAEGAPEGESDIISMLADLFTRENMNSARLSGYDESKHGTDYVLKLTDKELAAAINSVLDTVLKSDKIASALTPLGITDASSIVGLEQIILAVQDGIVAGKAAKIPVMRVTLSVKARGIVSEKIKTLAKGKDFSVLVNAIIPEKMFVTAQLALDKDAETLEHSVFINNMDEKSMDKIFDIVKGVTKLTGAEQDIKAIIHDKVQTTTATVLEKVNTYVPAQNMVEHGLSVDVFNTLIDVAGLNKDKDTGELKPEDKRLSASDLIKTLGGVVTSNPEDAIQKDHAFKNQHLIENNVVYDPTNLDAASLVDYEKEFMKEVASKYMLDLSGADKLENTADDVTFNDIMGLFGIGDTAAKPSVPPAAASNGLFAAGETPPTEPPKKLELLDLFNVKKLDDILALSPENKVVKINDRMMGAILNSQISSMLGSDGTIAKLNPQLEYVITSKKTIDNAENPSLSKSHNFIEVGMSVEVGGLLGDVGDIGKIITNLIGEQIVLVLKVDVTPKLEKAEYQASEVRYNSLDTAKTANILGTIGKFGVDFDVSSILAQVETPMRDAIGKMGDVIPVELCDSTVDMDATINKIGTALQLPSVFGTIDSMMFSDKDGKDPTNKITPQSIETVLRDINKINEVGYKDGVIKNPSAKDYDGFLTSITSKYYLAEKPASFDALFGAGGIASAGSFDASKFNFKNNKDGLFYDTRNASDLAPVFPDSELAKLVVDKMGSDPTYSELLNIQEFTINNNDLLMIIDVDFAALLGSGSADKLSLLPAKNMLIKAHIDSSSPHYYLKATTGAECDASAVGAAPFYPTTLRINEMTQETFDVLNAMMTSLNGGSSALDLNLKARDIGNILYEQINTLTSSIGSDVAFVAGGIQIPSFYNFLKKAVDGIATASDENIKGALQGLMPFSEMSTAGGHNYDPTQFATFNPVLTAIDTTHTVSVYEHPNIKISSTDRLFGQALASAINMKPEDNGGVGFTLNQLNIITKDSPDFARISDFVTLDAGGKDKPGGGVTEANDTALEFNFEMTGFSGAGSLSSIIPSTIYATIYLQYSNAAPSQGYTFPQMRINHLSLAEQKVLEAMIGTSAFGSIDAQINKITAELGAKYQGAQFGKYSDATKPAFTTPDKYKGYITYTQVF